MKELVKNNELLHTHTHTESGLFLGQRDMDWFARSIKILSEDFEKNFSWTLDEIPELEIILRWGMIYYI